MRLFLTCLLFLLFGNAVFGQSYKYAEMMAKADSLLSDKIGESLFLHCTPDAHSSYYSYEKKKKEKYKKLDKGHKSHKHFISASVRYNFQMVDAMCPCIDTISGSIAVDMDTVLNLVNNIDVSFIPRFVFANDSCHFITKQKAIEIALQQNLHLSVATPYAYLKTIDAGNTCVWIVLRTIWNEKSTGGTNAAKDDMVVIDAATGEIKETKVIPYAPHVY